MSAIKPTTIPKKNQRILKLQVKPFDAKKVMEEKKTLCFGSVFTRPNHKDVFLKEPELIYEQMAYVKCNCSVDYLRKASYQIKVDKNVREVIIGNAKFCVLSEENFLKKFEKKVKEGIQFKHDITLHGEEHIVKEITKRLYFDNHGNKILKFPYKLDSKYLENNPQRILDIHKDYIKKIDLTEKELLEKIFQEINEGLESDIKINSQNFVIQEYFEIFIPIYEARVFDSKKRESIIRVDGITGKVL